MHKTTRYLFLTLLSVFLFIGCASKQEPLKEAGLSVPELWASVAKAEPVQPWLADFNDQALEAIVMEALEGSYDLQAVAARMEAAHARARVTGADHLPELTADYGATKTDAGNSLSTDSTSYMDLGLTLAWELDLWGKIRNRVRASFYDYEAVRAELRGARLSLAINVARLYCDLVERLGEMRLKVISRDSFRKSLQVMEEGFAEGIYNAQELSLMRAAVAESESGYDESRERYDAASIALEALIGRIPSFIIEVQLAFPSIDSEVPVGLPSELVRRRPDIIEAEMRLASKDELFKAARKALLPDLTMTASVDSSSSSFERLLDPDYMLSKIVAAFAQPIFEGGRIGAAKDFATAERSEALALYAAAVLNAFKEVETALTAELYLRKQEDAQTRAVQSTENAELFVKEDYENGLVTFIDLLEAERRTYQVQLSLIKIKNRRLQNRLGLYLALGGEFMDIDKTDDKNLENNKVEDRREKDKKPDEAS